MIYAFCGCYKIVFQAILLFPECYKESQLYTLETSTRGNLSTSLNYKLTDIIFPAIINA